MFWLPMDPASRLFFYEFPDQNTDFTNIVLPKLKKSLSVTLQHYLPVAGLLTWPQDSKKPVVHYKAGDGVSLTIAETQSDFNLLSGNEFRDTAELRALLPDFPSSETQIPVVTLQITLFPNVGFSVGYVAHHGVVDGKSVSLFIHSWAHICKHGDTLPPELTPSFDRSFVDQQSELERSYPKMEKPRDPENKTLTIIDMTFPPDVLLATFKLTRENIDALKKSVYSYRKENNIEDKGPRLSTFIVSSSYTLVCLLKAKNITSGKAFLAFNANARGRLEPPVSSTYFGNCITGCVAFGDTKDYLAKDGLKVAAEAITEGISSLNDGLLQWANKINKMLEEGTKIDGPRDVKGFTVAGSPRFELYKADFGWGKPKKVEMVSIAKTGAFYLSDDRDGNGGIEIGIGLNKHEAEVFKSVFVDGLEF